MECPVCYEDYSNGDALKVLHCGHYFHAACIDKWLGAALIGANGVQKEQRATTCPMCKQDALRLPALPGTPPRGLAQSGSRQEAWQAMEMVPPNTTTTSPPTSPPGSAGTQPRPQGRGWPWQNNRVTPHTRPPTQV